MNKKTEEKLLAEYEKALNESDELFQNAPNGMDYDEFETYMEEINMKNNQISREYRFIKTPVFRKLSDFGDVMELKEFIINVKCGCFIDYDGFGYYVKVNQESDIEIYPSDVDSGYIRSDFDTIIWFNR